MAIARNLDDERNPSSGSFLNILSNGFIIEPRGGRTFYFKFEDIAVIEFDSNDSTMRITLKSNSDSGRWGWYNIERKDFTRLVGHLDAYQGSERKTALKVE